MHSRTRKISRPQDLEVEEVSAFISHDTKFIETRTPEMKYRHFSCATMQRQLFHRLSDSKQIEPYSDTVFASVCLADISGFTRLSARLSAEELKFHINEYFALLLSVVRQNSGDVVKFLGDAVLILWPIEFDASDEIQAAAVLMASMCSLQLLKDCGQYDRGEGDNKVELRLHCGVSCGYVHCMCTGETDRWEYIVSGEPLKQVGEAESEAVAGEVCLSGEAYSKVQEHLEGLPMPHGSVKLTGYLKLNSTIINLIYILSNRQNKHTTTSISDKIEVMSMSTHDNNNNKHNTHVSNSTSDGELTSTLATSTSIPEITNQIISPEVFHIANILKERIRKNPPSSSTSSSKSVDIKDFVFLLMRLLDIDANIVQVKKFLENFLIPSSIHRIFDKINNNTSTTNHHHSFTSSSRSLSISPDHYSFINTTSPLKFPAFLKPSMNTNTNMNTNHTSSLQTSTTATSNSKIGNRNETDTSLRNNNNNSSSNTNSNATFATSNNTTNVSNNNNSNNKSGNNTMNIYNTNTNSSTNANTTQLSKISHSISSNSAEALNSFKTIILQPPTLLTSFTRKLSRTSKASHDSDLSNSSVTSVDSTEVDDEMNGANLSQKLLLEDTSNSNNHIYLDELHKNTFSESIYTISPILKYFVHYAARDAIQNNTDEYLPELRNVVTIFIELLNMNEDLDRGRLHKPQQAMSAILSTLKRYQGSLRQYVVDDKGCVMIAAFGLPDSSHEDNCIRAVEVAIEVRHKFQKLSIDCRIGVAEGRVYCGVVGCINDRCEYAMMGCSVNLAARLMGKCTPGDIIVNDTVHEMATSAFTFLELPQVEAKGYSKPVRVFRPVERANNQALLDNNTAGISEFVGRAEEIKLLGNALKKLRIQDKDKQPSSNLVLSNESLSLVVVDNAAVASSNGNVIVGSIIGNNGNNGVSEAQSFLLEGVAGVGKTRLVSEVIKRSETSGIKVNAVVASATAAHTNTPYYVVRQLLEHIFDLKTGTSLVTTNKDIPKDTTAGSGSNTRFQHVASMTQVMNSMKIKREKSNNRSMNGPLVSSLLHHNNSKFDSSEDHVSNRLHTSQNIDITQFGQSHTPQTQQQLQLQSQISQNEEHAAYYIIKTWIDVHCTTTTAPSHANKCLDEYSLPHLNENILQNSEDSLEVEALFRSPVQTQCNFNSLPIASTNSSLTNRSGSIASSMSNNVSATASSVTSSMRAIIYHATSTSIAGHSRSMSISNSQPVGALNGNGSITGSNMNGIALSNGTGPIGTSNSTNLTVSPALSFSMQQAVTAAMSINHNTNNHITNTSRSSSNTGGGPGQGTGPYGVSIEDMLNQIPQVEVKLEDIIPLLGEILHVRLHDNTTTVHMKATDRKRMTDSLVLKILLIAIDSGFNLILIDNLQLIDIQSLRILVRLKKAMNKGILISTRRPADTQQTSNLKTLTALEIHRRNSLMKILSKMSKLVELKPLSPVDVKTMMTKIIGSELLGSYPDVLSANNVGQLLERAGGSPFHALALTKELRRALVTNKYTGIKDLPAGAHNIVVARFDQLNNTEQVILKTAAIIGIKFFERELKYALDALEHENCVNVLHDVLPKLVANNLIAVDGSRASEDSNCYIFADRSVQESVYNLMIGTVREHVHSVVGEYLEEFYINAPGRFEDIVHHYILSDNLVKKVEYLEYAAINAESTNEFNEMFRYYGQLIKLATGSTIEELLNLCCKKNSLLDDKMSNNSNSTKIYHSDERNFQTIRMLSMKRIPTDLNASSYNNGGGYGDGSESPGFVIMTSKSARVSRWISSNDIFKKVPLLSTLGQTYGTSSLTPAAVSGWLGQMGIAQAMLGNLPESNNLLILSLYNSNAPIPKIGSVPYLRRRSFFLSIKDKFFPPTIPTLNSLQIIKKYLNMFQIEASLYLIQGYPIPALEMIETANKILIKNKDSNHNTIYISEETFRWGRESKEIKARFDMLKAVALTASCHHTGTKQIVNELISSTLDLDVQETGDDSIILFCRAILISVNGDLHTASDLLGAAADSALGNSNRHLHNMALIHRAWVYLLSGQVAEATVIVNQVLTYSSNVSNSCLNIWSQEIDIMLKTIQYDFNNAENSWEKMKLIQKKDKLLLSPTTCALIAFSLCRDSRFKHAKDYALYACKKLSTRQQSSLIGGVILFCGLYAALDITENLMKEYISHSIWKISDIGIECIAAAKRLEDMSLNFPCLILLHLTISCRISRLFHTKKQGLFTIQNEVDLKLNKIRNTFSQFIFGNAFFHLQRALLCDYLGISCSYMKTSDSKLLAKKSFRKLGMFPSELTATNETPTPNSSERHVSSNNIPTSTLTSTLSSTTIANTNIPTNTTPKPMLHNMKPEARKTFLNHAVVVEEDEDEVEEKSATR